MQDKRELLTIGQVSEYLGVSIDTIRRWEKKGRIDALRSPGGHRYFDKKDLDNLFGKKYTRDEPTIRSKTKEETSKDKTPESANLNETRIISKDSDTYNLQPTTDNLVLDRPIRQVEIPPAAPIRIILEERQAFIQTTAISDAQAEKTSILTPQPQVTPRSPPPPLSPVTPTPPIPPKKLLINKIWIIVGGIVILLIVFFVIFLWQSSQKVLSPIP